MTVPVPEERTAVYRFYAADETLLYVGVTQRFGTRWSNHAKGKPWWPQVARQAVVWYDTRAEALAIETEAIKTENPVHNVLHIPKPPKPRRPANESDHTFVTRFRIPRRLWDAYGTAAAREGVDRSADLVDHVRTFIEQHGNEHERAELAAADQELAERRARKGGRPKKDQLRKERDLLLTRFDPSEFERPSSPVFTEPAEDFSVRDELTDPQPERPVSSEETT
jgi:predicted GIY-YIG superfamily endonuclease